MSRIALGLSCWLFATACFSKPVSVVFEKNARGHEISPYIYGLGTYLHEDRAAEGIWEIRPTLYRWGGNTSTRYNYDKNVWNSGADYFFQNYSGGSENIVDRFMQQNREKGVASMITLPMMGFVAKDGVSHSYPRNLFPKQDAFEGEAGNGKSGGKDLPSTDPYRTSIKITPEIVAGWVKKLKGQFGKHPHFYILDNEPMLWNSTHRDVQPEPMGYDNYLRRYIEYAVAVRAADPEAVIVGPALWGWLAMEKSGRDLRGPWSKDKPDTDRKAHGGEAFFEWFIGEIAKEEKKRGISLLDMIDVHFYPQSDSWPAGGVANNRRRAALLRSPRSLWDPSFTDESWIDSKVRLIPRLMDAARKMKPGTKISIGEYNFYASDDPSGALVQAEVLGVLAGSEIYAAEYWTFPKKGESTRQGFEFFRNFDGKGAAFAEQWVPNPYGIKDDGSVFAAQSKNGKRRTIAVLNKKTESKQVFDLNLAAYGPVKSARLISFVPAGRLMSKSEKKLPSGTRFTVEAAALSMHMLELNY